MKQVAEHCFREMIMQIRIANWNVGGAKFLKLTSGEREVFRNTLTLAISDFCTKWQPDVICLQEITRFQSAGQQAVDLIVAPPGYYYTMAPLVDTERHSHPVRWQQYKKAGHWKDDDYIAQGSGFLWKKELKHDSLWEFGEGRSTAKIQFETVPIETGLFTGDRDTEPRCAIVSHFLWDAPNGQIRDVYIVNLHLSTLNGERDGRERIDRLGSEVRLGQLNTVLHGIVSRHVVWSQMIDERSTSRRPVWLLCGDFNSAPDSAEIQTVCQAGFHDLHPNKGLGNKARGLGNNPSHTVDYILVNYQEFDQIQKVLFDKEINKNPEPDLNFRISDHFPIIATIPLL